VRATVRARRRSVGVSTDAPKTMRARRSSRRGSVGELREPGLRVGPVEVGAKQRRALVFVARDRSLTLKASACAALARSSFRRPAARRCATGVRPTATEQRSLSAQRRRLAVPTAPRRRRQTMGRDLLLRVPHVRAPSVRCHEGQRRQAAGTLSKLRASTQQAAAVSLCGRRLGELHPAGRDLDTPPRSARRHQDRGR